MNIKSCPTCSNPIPLAAPGGFCPTCLLREAAEPLSTGQTAPSLEEVAIAFPALEILSLIGQGGMGAVYKVRQPSLDRIVALKILSPELSRDPAFAERFAREARVLGKLNHPNIVTVYEHGESGGYYFLIMEYVDGVNLRQAMRAGRFTPEQALSIVPGICDALQAAHAQGIWHRDIKPENILLDQRGGVKIADFGIARLVGDQTKNFTLTGTGNALGSIAYMAPEQHESPHTVDHRADIYSLGVVIYEMLTGELPLGRFPAPSQRAAVSARIDEIVFQTLEKERELRQQSATEVKTDVQGATATKESTKTWANVPHPPSKQTLIALSLMLIGITLRFFGYEVVPNVYLPQHRIVLLSTTASVLINIGESLLVFGYIWGLYSLWEMKRGLKPPVWRPLLECVTVIPILFRGLKWWSRHSPRSLRWTFALLLVVGPAIPLIYWLANDRPTVANSISANFYLWAILVLVAVFGGGKMIWTMILRPDCYPKRAYQVAFWVLALFCAGLAVWLQPLPEPTNSDAWQHTLAYGGICGAAGVSALALLFSPTRWGVVGLVLCSFVLGHNVFRSWAFPSKTDTTNVQALSPDSEAWSYTPRHMTLTEIETFLKSPPDKDSPIDKKRNFGWTEGMTTQFSDGKFTLAGPNEQVRPFMSWIRMMDITKIPPVGTLRDGIPPDLIAILAVAAMMVHDEFDRKMLGTTFVKTLQVEKITAAQLARSLRNHVWEFESATITGEQKPNSGKMNGLTDATVFEITVPCSDRNDRPLKLSLIEINFGFRKEHKLISLSPWLLEEAKQQSAEPFTKQPEEPKQTSAKSPDSEAWSYTPRHMTSTEIETCLNNLINKDRSFGWVEGMTTQFSNGSLRLEGPRSQVRPLMSRIRMLDITRITHAGTRLGEIPPSLLSIFVVNAMMFHDEFDKKMLGPALHKTLQVEKISAPQLARSLRNHVWEFENIMVAGIPKEKGTGSNELAATTTYQITIPCSDRKSDPLKLSFIEISEGFKKDLELVNMSPWLLEEAKLQSAEPFEIKAVDPKQSPKSVGETSAQPKAADTSRPNGHSLGGSQRSLFTIEAPEFRGSEEFGCCDVQDVVGSIADSLSMILRQNCSLQEDHVCHNVCMHNDSGFLVHEIVVQPGRTFDIANFPTEHQQTECVVELEFIDEMHQQRLDVHTEALFGGRSIHIRAVIRDQKAGIDADHNAMIISKSIRSTHVFKEFVQVLLRQHRFSSAITETSALAPVHSSFLSGHRLADWFSFHHNILATSHPSEDGGQTSLQVV